ncbi:hypothetical protein HMPREF9071_1122 [Capnocytophaga sp. oral taxon 338 str. F0234]|nr:hypothetical protein HMPREF9071_1122 [Capnocytophaga sp. oral taxon 338 str. F0234]
MVSISKIAYNFFFIYWAKVGILVFFAKEKTFYFLEFPKYLKIKYFYN